MSRHNRKRRGRPKTTAPPVPPRPPKHTLAARLEERPKAPWHPVPLVEIAVLVGIVCLVVGFFTRDATYGRTLIALGLALGSLGGLETTAREHFAGYRSHTLVLAAFPAVAAAILAAVAKAPALIIPPLMALVFAAAFMLLRRAWRRTAKRTHA